MLTVPNIEGQTVLNLGGDAGAERAFVTRAADPVIAPQPYVSPADFAAQFPQPLDTTEIIAMCEELSAWQAIPVNPDGDYALNAHTWRELNSLAFTSGSAYISFADGECPLEYTHNGTDTTINLKNIGAKKSLSLRDIKHSMAVASAGWNGINRLSGGVPSSQGMPGGNDAASFALLPIADLKEKEVRLASTLVLNGWDRLLIEGDVDANSLEFDGIENQVTSGNGSHTNSAPSGTFSAATYDQFLAASCAKPTTIFGHPAAIQEMLSGYFQLGFAGSQVVNFSDGNRITPGFNFAGFVNSGVGRLAIVADNNFNRTASGATTFQTDLFSLRMTHNGVPLVFRLDQIPFHMKDLAPGCTAISFQVWAATALIVKHRCAHGRFTNSFTGVISATCSVIG